MIRSNSKTAINNIHNYIMENTDFSNYDMENPSTFPETASLLMHTFYEEMYKWDKNRYSAFDSFCNWLAGLPSVFDSCYYYNRSAVSDVAKILQETEQEANKYTEQEAEKMLSWLIWREIYKACKYDIE